LIGQIRTVQERDDTLRYINNGRETILLPLGKNKFQAVVGSDDVIIFDFFEEANQKSYSFSSGGSDPVFYNKINQITPSNSELSIYTGTYINEQSGQIYSFDIEENKLTAKHYKNEDIVFSPVTKDVFNAPSPFFAGIEFERKNGKVVGFTIQVHGFRNVRFEKVKE